VIADITEKFSLTTQYNAMGQVISQGQRQLEWDPWGRLLKVADPSFTWEASYDAFGRRLQTRHTPANSSTITTTSFYDPEKEFEEIGVQIGDKIFWKLYGPDSCDAIIDETGATVYLMQKRLKGIDSSRFRARF
jgi:YD repeat-containing protein